MEKSIIKELKGCNINWADEAGNTIPRAYINFSSLKNKYEANYWVTDANGKMIVPPQKMYFKKDRWRRERIGATFIWSWRTVEFEGE